MAASKRLSLLFAVFGLVVAVGPVAGQAPVEVKVVKYPQLGEAVKARRGRVVVVDFWSEY